MGHRAERPTSAPSETCPFLLAYEHIAGEFESRAVVSNSLRIQSMEILQARTLEWVAFPACRGSSQPRGRT